MVNRLMVTFLGFDFLFLGMAGLILGFSLMSEAQNRGNPTKDSVARELLLRQCPLTAGVINSIIMFVTFLVSLPALVLRNNKGWLRAHGWMVVASATFTLALGLLVWVDTLKTRSNLLRIWSRESRETQSLLQQKFNCCGYMNSTSPLFANDNICPGAAAAAGKQGCVGPFSSFANGFLDVIFTALFGVVGVHAMMLLCTVCVLKHRQELERYRHIDEKNGL